MAQKKKGGLAVLHRHYDKVVAVLVLIGLLVSLLYLSQSARVRQTDSLAFDQTLQEMRQLHPTAGTIDPSPYKTAQKVLATPMQMQPATNLPFLVAQERVWCVKCRQPIPIDDEVCSYCETKQPGNTADEGWDSDGDGIPDLLERQYGMNPLDKSDGNHDLDNDGFTNLEEFQARTSLTDPKNHPPRIAFLRVKEVAMVPFPLVLRGTMRGNDNRIKYQVNDKTSGQTFTVLLGQPIGKTGYTITEATTIKVTRKQAGWTTPREVEIHVITVTRGSTTVVLEQDAPQTSTDYVVSFICTKDTESKEYTGRRGESFTFDGEAYEVIKVDIGSKPVVIRRLSNKEEIVVPQR